VLELSEEDRGRDSSSDSKHAVRDNFSIEDLKTALGMLFSQGWTLDDVLDMSIKQIFLVTECSMMYKSEVADYVISVVSSALGGKATKSKKSKKGNKKRRSNNDGLSLANDGAEAVMSKFQAFGIGVETKSDK
tara:strand:- start:107 stop:505 length:399 start_codon:yes stop_codon:yes gene_type:complete